MTEANSTAIRAVDLVTGGECSPSCLLASGDEGGKCSCRCTGRYHGALINATIRTGGSWWDRCGRGGWSDMLLSTFSAGNRTDLYDAVGTWMGWCAIERRGRSYSVLADVRRRLSGGDSWDDEASTLMNRFSIDLLKTQRATSSGYLPAEWFDISNIRSLIEARVVLAILQDCWHLNFSSVVRAIEVLEGREDPVRLGLNPEKAYPERLIGSFEPPKRAYL